MKVWVGCIVGYVLCTQYVVDGDVRVVVGGRCGVMHG